MRNPNDISALTMDATMETESLTGADDASSFVHVEASLPEDAVSLKVIPKHEVIGMVVNESTTEICVSMTAAELPDDDDDDNDDTTRAPVDIIIALDVSGSMNGTPLALCKRTLEMLLRVLLPRDRFGLVTYASDARVDFPAQKMTADHKEAALVNIRSLHTRGQTNISAAIGLAAFEMQAMIENANDVRTIFLLTDGHANQGVCDVAGLVAITKNSLLLSGAQHETPSVNRGPSPFAQSQSQGPAVRGAVPRVVVATSAPPGPPISMHCFGYGTNHNAELLREIASAASGSYYFVENDTNVGSAFGDCVGGVLSVVAQNAVVTIKPCAEASALGMEIVKVHHDQSIKRENGSHTVTVGDFYAEESRDVLVTVKLARPESPNSTPIIPHLSVSLSYTDILQKRPKQTGPIVCSIARPAGSELSDPDTHVTAQWLRVFATEEMAAADVMAQNQDLVGARARIQNVQEQIQLACASVQSDGMIQELCESMSVAARGLESVNQYTTIGSKHMSHGMRAYKTQRAAASTPSSGGNYYANKRKKAFAADFKLGEEE